MTPTPADATIAGRATPQARSDRVEQIVVSHLHDIYRRTDRMFAYLMGVQWLAGIAFALLIAPRTGSGATSQTDVHVWTAVVLGGPISLFPALLAVVRPGRASTRYTIATAQMLTSALLIHLTGGRIETHFHVFASLAVLAFYRDWRVLVPATIVVALDQMLRGLFWPESIYGVLVASEWRWVEHVAWVAFEDVALVMSCTRGVHELREIAVRTAVLEDASRDEGRHLSAELGAPLKAITLYSELLHENAVAADRLDDAEDLMRIRRASQHLQRLINGVMDRGGDTARRPQRVQEASEALSAFEPAAFEPPPPDPPSFDPLDEWPSEDDPRVGAAAAPRGRYGRPEN